MLAACVARPRHSDGLRSGGCSGIGRQLRVRTSSHNHKTSTEVTQYASKSLRSHLRAPGSGRHCLDLNSIN